MASTFRFPPLLLHTATEPQWLPRPKEEANSKFDELTRQQEAFISRTRRQVIPPPPEAIGMSSAEDAKNKKPDPPPEVDVAAPPARPAFWERYLSQVEDLRRNSEGR